MAKYVPKIYHFEFDEIGTMLACLDNNKNTGREQKKTVTRSSGLKMSVKNHFRIAYLKPTKKFIARKFYEKKSYKYLKVMLDCARNNAAAKIKNKEKTKRKHMAPEERQTRESLITQCTKYKRFKF